MRVQPSINFRIILFFRDFYQNYCLYLIKTLESKISLKINAVPAIYFYGGVNI